MRQLYFRPHIKRDALLHTKAKNKEHKLRKNRRGCFVFFPCSTQREAGLNPPITL